MSRALLQQALDWYEKDSSVGGLAVLMEEIEEELAKPDEPVAYRQYVDGSDESNLGWWDYLDADESHDGYEPLYTSPQPKLTPSDFWNAAPWQPMETAPKDTAGILLKNSDGEIQICQFGIGSWKFGAYYEETFHEPMAWIPLPEQK